MKQFNWDKVGIDISKVRGGKTLCPNCSHTRKHKSDPCLSVDLKTGLYNCHNDCGFKGTALEYMKPKKEYIKPVGSLQKVSDKLLKWFEGRGISNNTLLRFKITESEEYFAQVEAKRTAINFNYYRNEELVNVKYRDAQKNFRLVKDAELIFYNLDSLEGQTEAIITEGEIDCLSMYESGFFNSVSVPNGASKGSQRLEYLDNCIDYFQSIDKIIICTDNDSAGITLKDELCRRLGKERCWLVTYPVDCKDANEVLINHGKEAVQHLINSAYQYPIEGIETIDDCAEEVLNMYENGFPFGKRIGIDELDQLITWKTGELTTITGMPGSGKSTWLNNILIELVKQHDWRIAMFTPEKQPTSILVSELSEIFIGKAFYRPDPNSQMSKEQLFDAMEFIKDRFYFMKIDEIDVTVEGILDKARELVKRHGVNALVIDPWNYVEHKMPRGYSETQYISEALTQIKRFKDRAGCHVFLIAHPTKIKKTNGVFDVPTLYDIAGSAHFYNKTDNGIVVYRDYNAGVTEIHIQKIRWVFIGKIGKAVMSYDVNCKRYRPNNILSETSSFSNRLNSQRLIPLPNYTEPQTNFDDGYEEVPPI